MAFGAPSLKGRALRYLAQREHSRAELARKLQRFAVAANAAGRGDDATASDRAGHGVHVEVGVGAADYDDDAPLATARAQIDAALDELAAHGLLSDERAAASVLQSQAPKAGQRRLKQTLQAKGLAPELISRTLAQVQGTEQERAQALWQRRFGSAPADARERARQVRFLQGRGFGSDVIGRVMRLAGSTVEDSDS